MEGAKRAQLVQIAHEEGFHRRGQRIFLEETHSPVVSALQRERCRGFDRSAIGDDEKRPRTHVEGHRQTLRQLPPRMNVYTDLFLNLLH